MTIINLCFRHGNFPLFFLCWNSPQSIYSSTYFSKWFLISSALFFTLRHEILPLGIVDIICSISDSINDILFVISCFLYVKFFQFAEAFISQWWYHTFISGCDAMSTVVLLGYEIRGHAVLEGATSHSLQTHSSCIRWVWEIWRSHV